MLGFRSTRRIRALVGHSVLLAVPAISFARAGFTSGSATWSWDADSASALGGKTTFAIAPPSSSLIPASPTFQLSKSGSSGGSTATGKGSLGYVANPTTASWTFGGGSGAAQSDPGNILTGDTITKVRFGGLFDVTSPGFGPTAVGYFSLSVAGTAGVSGSTQIAFDMQWRKNGPDGPLLRSAISNGTTFFGGAEPTPFRATYTYATPFSPNSLPATDNIWVGGSLTFIADNMGTPSDVAPVQFEASAAPPTATAFAAGTSSWFAPATWQAPNNPAAGVFSFTELNAAVPTIPNAIGDRARFVNVGDGARNLNLNNPVTLGSLLIDDNDAVVIQPTPSFGAVNLTFDTQSGGSSIHIGSGAGSGAHEINVPVVLNKDLDIRVEAADPVTFAGPQLTFNQPITNTGGAAGTPRSITVSGGGVVNFNATNDYRGTTTVLDNGQLRVNAAGGLGTASASVSNGRVIFNTPTPFATAVGSINVGQNGVVQVDLVPGSTSTKIVCANQFAGVSGTPAVLGAMRINNEIDPGNIVATSGAFIGHTVFDTSAAGNPIGIGNSPRHTFGVSANMGSAVPPVLTIGTEFDSPWIGIGGDRGRFAFGDPGADGGVVVRGEAEVSSLAGEFIINTRFLSDEDGGGLARIKGSGMVILAAANNGFDGDFVVHPGATLSIDGDMAEVQSITVQPGATFGGGGSIADLTAFQGDDPTPSLVVVQDGGILDPGLGVYNNVQDTFEADDVQLSQNSILDFEFGGSNLDEVPNDVLEVKGSLTLDGQLIINQLQDFDNQTQYTLIEFFGPLVNNGLEISPLSQEIFGFPAEQVASLVIIPRTSGATGGSVVLIVPEPSAAMLLAGLPLLRSRRRR